MNLNKCCNVPDHLFLVRVPFLDSTGFMCSALDVLQVLHCPKQRNNRQNLIGK
jgi:hypothetical protein